MEEIERFSIEMKNCLAKNSVFLELDESQISEIPSSSDLSCTTNQHQFRVLVVNDCQNELVILISILKLAGFEAEGALNGF